ICSAQGRDQAGSSVTTTLLLVGTPAAGGVPLGDGALFVKDSDAGTRYLLWQGRRYRITGDDPDAVIRSLYGFQAQVVEVGTAWLNSLPAGQDIGPIPIERFGEESDAVHGLSVGVVVFHSEANGRPHYLVLDVELAHLPHTQLLSVRRHHDSA